MLTQTEIDALIAVEKPVPEVWRRNVTPRRHANTPMARGEQLIEVLNDDLTVSRFKIFTRTGRSGFSAGIAYAHHDGWVNLVRCNGPQAGEHRNRIERNRIQPARPHIHWCTERYWRAFGISKADSYAVTTDRYCQIDGAIDHLSRLVHLVPDDTRLFA